MDDCGLRGCSEGERVSEFGNVRVDWLGGFDGLGRSGGGSFLRATGGGVGVALRVSLLRGVDGFGRFVIEMGGVVAGGFGGAGGAGGTGGFGGGFGAGGAVVVEELGGGEGEGRGEEEGGGEGEEETEEEGKVAHYCERLTVTEETETEETVTEETCLAAGEGLLEVATRLRTLLLTCNVFARSK